MNKKIVLIKRWFDKVNGNTYHSVQFKDGFKIHHSGQTYGYERQYEQTYKDLLREEGYCEDFIKERFNNTDFIVIDNCKKKELKEIHEYK